MKRFLLQESTRHGWWVLTDTENDIVIRFKKGFFNETQNVTFLDEHLEKKHTAVEIAHIMRLMGDYMVRYHSDICFDTPFGFKYSDDDKHLYLYRSTEPKWVLEILSKFDKNRLAATLRKAAEFLSKGYGQTKE